MATASQPGQRQRPLTNSVLVTSGVLEGRKQYYFQFLSFTSDVAGSTFTVDRHHGQVMESCISRRISEKKVWAFD